MHSSYGLPYKVECDWCGRKADLELKSSDAELAHYHKVNRVEKNNKVKLRHICTICLENHEPFMFVKNGIVHYRKFTKND